MARAERGKMKDQMLLRIRDALGREPGDRIAPVPPVRLTESSPGDRVKQFSAALTALGGSVIEVADEIAAASQLKELLDGKQFAASGAPVLKSMGLAQAFSRDACAQVDIGVTSADYALADTGTLVFLSESGESRLISLLPPRHIALIERAKILASLDELLSILPHPGLQSSSMVLVTGPSRTADIEMRLVRGVHGPGDVTVIVIG
jgi:L-lactate dehydrogenase complex protein LldG